jgi:hypothetical protein
MESIFILGFLLMLGLPTGLYLLFTNKIQSGLMQRHHPEWIDLGSPQVRAISPSSTAKFLRFCWSKRVQSLNDPEISRQVVFWRICLLWSVVGYFILLGIMVKAAHEAMIH